MIFDRAIALAALDHKGDDSPYCGETMCPYCKYPKHTPSESMTNEEIITHLVRLVENLQGSLDAAESEYSNRCLEGSW